MYYTNHPDSKAHKGSAVLIRLNIKHLCYKITVKATYKQEISWQQIGSITYNTISALYYPPKFYQ